MRFDRPFEQYALGERHRSRGRTITEAGIVQFAGVSGDFYPLHMDGEYAKRTPFGERIAWDVDAVGGDGAVDDGAGSGSGVLWHRFTPFRSSRQDRRYDLRGIGSEAVDGTGRGSRARHGASADRQPAGRDGRRCRCACACCAGRKCLCKSLAANGKFRESVVSGFKEG